MSSQFTENDVVKLKFGKKYYLTKSQSDDTLWKTKQNEKKSVASDQLHR